MKDNRYEKGDDIPEGFAPGSIVDVELERKKLGIVVTRKERKIRSRKQLEKDLDDAIARIEELEAKL